MASSRRNHNALSATEARTITARAPRLFLSLSSLAFPCLSFNKFCRRTDPVTSMEIQLWHVFRLNYLGNGPPPVLISLFFFFLFFFLPLPPVFVLLVAFFLRFLSFSFSSFFFLIVISWSDEVNDLPE